MAYRSGRLFSSYRSLDFLRFFHSYAMFARSFEASPRACAYLTTRCALATLAHHGLPLAVSLPLPLYRSLPLTPSLSCSCYFASCFLCARAAISSFRVLVLSSAFESFITVPSASVFLSQASHRTPRGWSTSSTSSAMDGAESAYVFLFSHFSLFSKSELREL